MIDQHKDQTPPNISPSIRPSSPREFGAGASVQSGVII
jgi:hypothetical protein